MKKSYKLALALSISSLLIASCSSDSSENTDGKLSVIAAFYPIEFVVSAIGGDLVSIENMTPPGVEPHDLELTASQVTRLSQVDLLFSIKGFQPALDEAATQSPPGEVIDLLTIDGLNLLQATEDSDSHGDEEEGHSDEEEGHSDEEEGHGDEEMINDPHFWLDPKRLVVVANAVAAKFSAIDADNAQTYESNRSAFVEKLELLDQEYVTGLQSCERRMIVTSHAAFGYLASAYNLEQEAIAGLSPDAEPTPKRLNEISKEAKADGTTTIFFETLASPKLAKTLADDLKIKAAVLDPVEGVGEGQTYFSVMESNLSALRAALSCK